MLINADLSKRVVVNTNDLNWIDSPSPGIQRRMLERDGDEIARATSIVRYAPDSSFASHVHDGGEEFLVLEGIFSDETGDFHEGMYVRNPPGSKHEPYTKEGCVILVKLRQFEPDDHKCVRIDTKKGQWLPEQIKGICIMQLHQYGNERVALMKWDKLTCWKRQGYIKGEEIYVISGNIEDRLGTYPAGTWIRNPAGEQHTLHSKEGCLLYVKTGHL